MGQGIVIAMPTEPFLTTIFKLKRDYIPGYGDTADLIAFAASWDKDRGREVRLYLPPWGHELTSFEAERYIVFFGW